MTHSAGRPLCSQFTATRGRGRGQGNAKPREGRGSDRPIVGYTSMTTVLHDDSPAPDRGGGNESLTDPVRTALKPATFHLQRCFSFNFSFCRSFSLILSPRVVGCALWPTTPIYWLQCTVEDIAMFITQEFKACSIGSSNLLPYS